jgi:hypothetical protein
MNFRAGVAMQILVRIRDRRAALMREPAERRAKFVLRRHSSVVSYASVQLSDLNGPRGGVDKHCQVAVRTIDGKPVIVNAVASDWRTALDRALTRAAGYLRRLWDRRNPAAQDRRRMLPQDPRRLTVL